MLARLVFLAMATLIAAARPAHAEGWRHTAPEGYAATPGKTSVQYLKAAGSQYCLLALYNPRPRAADDTAELAEEWRGVVGKTFTAGPDKTLAARTTRKQLRYLTRTAALVDGKGGSSYGELYV